MAEFENREEQYNDNLGLVIGRFCTAIVEADSEAKDAYTKRVLALVKAGNVDFVADTTIIGSKSPLQTRVSVPTLSVTDAKPIEISTATLDLDMTVDAHRSDVTSEQAKAGGSGEAKIGYGPFSVGIKVTASMSVSNEHKRTSDYRSHTHAHVEMGQAETPEGISLILDSLNKSTSKALEINQAIIQAKIDAVAGEAVKSGDAPKPSNDPKPKK